MYFTINHMVAFNAPLSHLCQFGLGLRGLILLCRYSSRQFVNLVIYLISIATVPGRGAGILASLALVIREKTKRGRRQGRQSWLRENQETMEAIEKEFRRNSEGIVTDCLYT